MKKRVLFVCTHNSARSQMAEGYMNARYGDRYELFSAGTVPGTLSLYAVRALAEIGINIFGHRSKDLGEFDEQEMDYLVAVCEGGICPLFPRAKEEIHREFPDSSKITGTDEEIMAGVRRIRGEIIGWIDTAFGAV